MPATRILPRSRIPKLRSSCDSCGTAKVKCDRKQPQCGRCRISGRACVYSQSRHCGKPPRKRLASEVTAHGTSKRQAMNVYEGSHVGASSCHALSESEELQCSDPAAGLSATTFEGMAANSMNAPDQPGKSSFMPTLGNEWFTSDIFPFGLDYMTGNLQSTSASNYLLGAAQITAHSSQQHSCPRDSYEVFRDLICPTDWLHAPYADSSPVSAQLDEVLRFTSNAIDRLTWLLQCPCARSGHRVMVHASIISRILLWYQQAAGWTNVSHQQLQPPILDDEPSAYSPSRDTGTTLNSEAAPTLVQSTGFVVEHVPVSVGTFSVEDQNVQAAFKDQLVLSELKKMSALIELFTSLQDSSSVNIAGLHTHLGTWLRSEHSQMVNMLTARLGASNSKPLTL